MKLFQKRPYVAGVSGGPDSMAMLTLFHRYIRVVCIVNYHLREAADTEVALVQAACARYHIPCEVRDVYPPYTGNFQHVARQIRYDFFKEMAQKYHAKKLLLAHQFDDFLETAYLQQNRHSAALYYGINPHSSYQGLPIFRPLLFDFRKADLEQFCRDQHVPYAIDASNFDPRYARNAARRVIQAWDDPTCRRFFREIQRYNRAHAPLRKAVEQIWATWLAEQFPLTTFLGVAEEAKPHLIYMYLRHVGEENCSTPKLHGICAFLTPHPRGAYRLEGGKFLRVQDGHLTIDPGAGNS